MSAVWSLPFRFPQDKLSRSPSLRFMEQLNNGSSAGIECAFGDTDGHLKTWHGGLPPDLPTASEAASHA